MSEESLYCPKCGADVLSTDAYCVQCGTELRSRFAQRDNAGGEAADDEAEADGGGLPATPHVDAGRSDTPHGESRLQTISKRLGRIGNTLTCCVTVPILVFLLLLMALGVDVIGILTGGG